MDDLLKEFLTESSESIEVIDAEVVRLEQNPNDPELLSNIFRLMHTIKGTCGFLGLPRLERVAHAAENVLGMFRDGVLSVTPDAVTVILDSLDRIKSILAELEAAECEPEGDDSDLIERLNAFANAGGAPAADGGEAGEATAAEGGDDAAPAGEAAGEAATAGAGATAGGATLLEKMGGFSALDAVVEVFYRNVLADDRLKGFFENVNIDYLQGQQRAFFAKLLGGPDEYAGSDLRSAHRHLVEKGLDDSHFDAMAEHLRAALNELEVVPDVIDEIMALVEATRDDVLNREAGAAEKTDEAPAAAADDEPVAPAAEEKAPEKPADAGKKAQTGAEAGKKSKPARGGEPSVAAQSIRVNVELLENLMTMVSELVLTRNQLLQILRKTADTEFGGPLQRLSQVTSELQEGVMQTRMQPIGNAWAKLPRLVRDLSHELGKKIELEMKGAETELDRQILELIKDPLTHMVRNSADHGIEMPEERLAAGKPEHGTISLNAYHEGGHIVITISDDGAGLSVEKIKAKALASGLITEADLEGLSDQQIQQFIFKAGLSTAEKVTNVSGRGVGMDVVKTNIEKIGGTVELQSTEGKGSTFMIKIPLTLAIVSALIVEAGGERFAVPQISVVELVRASSTSEHTIEHVNGTPVLRLRNRLLPLISLTKLLRLEEDASEDGIGDEKFIIVSQVGTYNFGIIVDRVFDTEEIVVKPVAPILRDITIFSGNTILGDGSVIMILDPNGIAAASGDLSMAEEQLSAEQAASEAARGERIALLLFRAGDQTPKAVPLSLVSRLEEVEISKVEITNGQPVIQYRGQLMPLLPITPSQTMKESGRQPVIVLSDRARSVGLIVDEIIDIVEDQLNVELKSDTPGFLGSATIDGKAMDILDIGHYLNLAFPDWFRNLEAADEEVGESRRILLVDDSPFFRNLLTPLLSVAGYDVTTAESADVALDLCESGEDFDLIISDIEMPGMNGFEFAETVRKNTRWRDTPLVALSSHTSARDLGRGRESGFDDYVPKFDRDALLQSLSQTLSTVGGAA